MFVFVLDGELFKLSVNTPAFEPLFQLPPRIGHAVNNPFPYENGRL